MVIIITYGVNAIMIVFPNGNNDDWLAEYIVGEKSALSSLTNKINPESA